MLLSCDNDTESPVMRQCRFSNIEVVKGHGKTGVMGVYSYMGFVGCISCCVVSWIDFGKFDFLNMSKKKATAGVRRWPKY